MAQYLTCSFMMTSSTGRPAVPDGSPSSLDLTTSSFSPTVKAYTLCVASQNSRLTPSMNCCASASLAMGRAVAMNLLRFTTFSARPCVLTTR